MYRRNPQHIRRVSHSRRLLYIAAIILYRHCCRMVVKTYRLFLAGLEGLEPSTYGLRTTFRIRTETIIFIISKKWPLCVVWCFLIDILQLAVHCSTIELQTRVVVSINYTSEIRNSLKITKLFLNLFLFISRFYILYSKIAKKFNFFEYFSEITKDSVELVRNFHSITSPFSIYYTTRNEFHILFIYKKGHRNELFWFKFSLIFIRWLNIPLHYKRGIQIASAIHI